MAKSKPALDANMVGNMLRNASQEQEPESSNAPSLPGIPVEGEKAAFDPGAVDGRTLRKTHREPFATRIKPETHKTLKRIAFEREVTIAEVLELAVAAYAKS